jgi:hypothetical protein
VNEAVRAPADAFDPPHVTFRAKQIRNTLARAATKIDTFGLNAHNNFGDLARHAQRLKRNEQCVANMKRHDMGPYRPGVAKFPGPAPIAVGCAAAHNLDADLGQMVTAAAHARDAAATARANATDALARRNSVTRTVGGAAASAGPVVTPLGALLRLFAKRRSAAAVGPPEPERKVAAMRPDCKYPSCRGFRSSRVFLKIAG